MIKAGIKYIPAVNILLKGLTDSVQAHVRDVFIVLIFLFLLFAICGTQMFSGPQLHTRCRLTPYPVLNTWTPDLDYTNYKCIDGDVFNVPTDNSKWSKEDSPWYTPRTNCYWPIDNNDEYFCSLGSMSDGVHICGKDEYDNYVGERWCGSDFDALGNPRFSNNAPKNSGTYAAGLSYGYFQSDNIGESMFLLLLTLTTNGWAQIYSYLADTFGGIAGGLFLVTFVVLCAFFVLQLIIAIMEDALEALKREEIKEKKLELVRLERKRQLGLITNDNVDQYPTILERIVSFINTIDKPNENSFRRYLRSIVTHRYYELVVNSLVLVNSIILSMDHYPTNLGFYYVVDCINFILTIIFSFDGFLQILGQGLVDYFSSLNNGLDFIIIAASIADLADSPLPVYFGGPSVITNGSLSALRTFRLFRVLRLFRWRTLKMLFIKIIKIFISLGGFLAIFLFYLFIMTVIGSQLFANRFRFDENQVYISDLKSYAWEHAPYRSQSNFDDWNKSFATIFQLLTFDNWFLILLDTRRAGGQAGVLFPIVAICIGTYLILNLLVATVIQNLCSELLVEAEELIDQFDHVEQIAKNESDDKLHSSNDNLNSYYPRPQSHHKLHSSHDSIGQDINRSDEFIQKNNSTELNDRFLVGSFDDNVNENHASAINIMKDDEFVKSMTHSKSEVDATADVNEEQNLSGPRKLCKAIVESKPFGIFILMLILLSSITIAMNSPLMDPNSSFVYILTVIDGVCAWVFFSEMIMKFYAFGLIGKGGYFTDSWNYFDFIVVAVSIIDFFGSSNDSLRKLKALRALRAIRPLRIILRIKGLRQVVLALWNSAGQMAMAFGIYVLILFVFAIFLVGFFKGQFRSCSGSVYDNVISPDDNVNDYLKILQYPKPWEAMTSGEQSLFSLNSLTASYYSSHSSACSSSSSNAWPAQPCCVSDTAQSIFYNANSDIITSRMLCECWGGKWKYYINRLMDNVPMTMFGLFQLTTLEGNTEAMYATVDANGIDMQPIRYNNIGWVYFWAVFIFLSTFIGVNLFLGIVVENFLESLDSDGMSDIMTEEQKEWVRTQDALRKLSPIRRVPRPESRIRALFYDFVSSDYFIYFIYFCIVLQFVVLALHHFGESSDTTNFMNIANTVLSIIFLVEAILKMIGYGLKQYFKDRANVFDFCIVLGTIGGFVYLLVTNETKGLIINILRLLRVFRLLNASKNLRSVNSLIALLMASLPAVGNVALLLFLLVYVYSVLGVTLFAKVQLHDLITQEINFRTFGNAMITLITFSTGEGWNDYMSDLAFNSANCIDDPNYDSNVCGFSSSLSCKPINGCGDVSSYPYLVSFLFLVCFTFLNLFVGIVICEYQDAKDALVPHESLNDFVQKWHEYDVDGTCYIDSSKVIKFVSELSLPLGFGNQKYSVRQLNKRVGKLRVYINGNVHFIDVLAVLSAAYIKRQSKWQSTLSDFDDKELLRAKIKKTIKKSKIKDTLNKLKGGINNNDDDHQHHHHYHKYKSLPNGDAITFSHLYFASMIQTQWRLRKDNFSTTKGDEANVTKLWATLKDLSNDNHDDNNHNNTSHDAIFPYDVDSISPTLENIYPGKQHPDDDDNGNFGVDSNITQKLKLTIVNDVDHFYVPDWISSPKKSSSLPRSNMSSPDKGLAGVSPSKSPPPLYKNTPPPPFSSTRVTSPTTTTIKSRKDNLTITIPIPTDEVVEGSSSSLSSISPSSLISKSRTRAQTPASSPDARNTGWH